MSFVSKEFKIDLTHCEYISLNCRNESNVILIFTATSNDVHVKIIQSYSVITSCKLIVVITEVYNVMINNEKLIGTTEYMTL